MPDLYTVTDAYGTHTFDRELRTHRHRCQGTGQTFKAQGKPATVSPQGHTCDLLGFEEKRVKFTLNPAILDPGWTGPNGKPFKVTDATDADVADAYRAALAAKK